MKAKGPTVPPGRDDTIRHAMVALLQEEPRSARELSVALGIPEKEVYAHLAHVQKSRSHHLTIIPAVCKSCDFTFRKRTRVTKPGKCPVCHHETIREPLFAVA